MKTITLHFSDRCYARLRDAVGIKKMLESSYGIGDETLSYIISSIEQGLAEKTLELKEERHEKL
jgi:hypothetical protein